MNHDGGARHLGKPENNQGDVSKVILEELDAEM
jgi:hypothetical protein